MEKEKLFGKTLEELKILTAENMWPSFVAKQLADWLYKKDISSFDEMSNVSKTIRATLKEKYEVGISDPAKVQVSKDGTKKYLFVAKDGKFIEAAYIPEENRKTLCVSSQVGCKMGCLFCMTARQGFQGDLDAGEILNQLRSIPEWHEVTNIVYMGMGEPMDNVDNVLKSLEILTTEWGMGISEKRITVSTIGVIPGMKKFIENSNCHLAISLHTPFDDQRKKLMPIENVYPLSQIFSLLKEYDFKKQRRISFEYIMFKDFNDTPMHVNRLVKLLHGLRSRINLIRFHPIPGTPLLGSEDKTIMEFKDSLIKKGIVTTVRASRGQDIYAACGLLSTKELLKKEQSDY
ncbi:23S rRNA (adenine(2503)-C(2))-methyltransferase RlmN [Bacteroidota bacterium]